MRCLLNDQRCLLHCLDTSPEWTGARRINAHQRWDNVDTRPGETIGPSVGKGSRDELRDALLVSAHCATVVHRLSSPAASKARASACTRLQRAPARLL